jgi:ABC-type oligopeptide transport system ATPase subunit
MDAMTSGPPLVEARGLTKHFARRKGGFFRRTPALLTRAVDGIDLRIGRGETVGLLGESGSGKTTTGRLLLRLTEPSGGEIRFDGADVGAMRGAALKTFRTRAQLVFQNPFDALNPRFTVCRGRSAKIACGPCCSACICLTRRVCWRSSRTRCRAANCSAWCWRGR